MQYTDWKDLKQHKTPEWLLDGKFGIYTHWTPVVVATKDNHGDWYGNSMYQRDYHLKWNGEILSHEPRIEYEYHCNRFGNPKDFGYKDMIKLFQPKRFDADEWADIFEKAGAKFAGPVAIHHDNFAMWDSDVTRWNIKNNCGFDSTGELEKAIKKRNMHFLTAFHHSFSWYFFNEAYKFDAKDPENWDLYCEPHERCDDPSEQFENLWFLKLKEVMDKYNPDAIWFDFGLERISSKSRKKFMLEYYNREKEKANDLAVCYKIKSNPPFPAETGVLDFELGRSDTMRNNFWMTDTSVGPWFYQDKIKDASNLKTSHELINMLVDIVSKNGCMILNVTPNDDGVIIDNLKKILLEIGEWLKVNGEAIYNTRPWVSFGEGVTILDEPDGGGFNEKVGFGYTSDDIRYTRSKDKKTIYATIMGWKGENQEVLMQAFSKNNLSKQIDIKNISLLSSGEKLVWKYSENGLSIKMPSQKPDDIVAIKIETNCNVMDVTAQKQFIYTHI